LDDFSCCRILLGMLWNPNYEKFLAFYIAVLIQDDFFAFISWIWNEIKYHVNLLKENREYYKKQKVLSKYSIINFNQIHLEND
jgi:hypothetical protein